VCSGFWNLDGMQYWSGYGRKLRCHIICCVLEGFCPDDWRERLVVVCVRLRSISGRNRASARRTWPTSLEAKAGWYSLRF
jgi:hypothetical protein